MKTVTALFGALFLSGCSLIGVRSDTEHAPYAVVAEISDTIEVRRYPNLLVAEATAEADDEVSGRNAAFRLLFDYISGANRSKEAVAMTVPVETDSSSSQISMTVPVETAVDDVGTYSMRFYFPSGYDMENAPEPTNANVIVNEVPERTVAVLRFSGSTGTDNVARHTESLMRTLEENGLQITGDPTYMFYDPPWTLWFLRRNEVVVPVIAD
ncbi:MAG: heme-binding protein [Pseudomonadota bacterium]